MAAPHKRVLPFRLPISRNRNVLRLSASIPPSPTGASHGPGIAIPTLSADDGLVLLHRQILRLVNFSGLVAQIRGKRPQIALGALQQVINQVPSIARKKDHRIGSPAPAWNKQGIYPAQGCQHKADGYHSIEDQVPAPARVHRAAFIGQPSPGPPSASILPPSWLGGRSYIIGTTYWAGGLANQLVLPGNQFKRLSQNRRNACTSLKFVTMPTEMRTAPVDLPSMHKRKSSSVRRCV